MANIYELSQELIQLFDYIEDNDGELTLEIEEKLTIAEDNLKDKIKSYSQVVKILQADILAIKAEKDRLNDLQKRKEATIDRLKSILLEAVNRFGSETKAGGKFIDFGIGKVSVRNSKVVEVDEEDINSFVNHYIAGLQWYNMQNQLNKDIINPDELLRYANQFSDSEDEVRDLKYSMDDVAKLDADIDVRVSLHSLLESDKGFELAKALIKYGQFDIKAKVDKRAIKESITNTGDSPTFARIVDNQTVSIK